MHPTTVQKYHAALQHSTEWHNGHHSLHKQLKLRCEELSSLNISSSTGYKSVQYLLFSNCRFPISRVIAVGAACVASTHARVSCDEGRTAVCIVLGIFAGLFSLSLAAAPLVGELGLAVGGGVNGAEEGPAEASSAVMRLLRSRSIGVLGEALDAVPPCMDKSNSCADKLQLGSSQVVDCCATLQQRCFVCYSDMPAAFSLINCLFCQFANCVSMDANLSRCSFCALGNCRS